MDVSTVNNAVSDALAGLPAGTSSFITANMGTLAGQQAIANAGAQLGLSNAQIAAAVSQVTGQAITPQQVAQVASGVGSETAPPPAAPAAPSAPVNAPVFVGTPAPGAVGTNYGQASNTQITAAQQNAPDLATALQSGNVKMTYDGEGTPYFYDAKTGQSLNTSGYQIQVGQNGQIGINMPSANGSMVQVSTKMNQDGSLAPVNASNVLNVGVNQGAGGFGGGLGGMTPILGAGLAIASMGTLIPYIAAYNAADAVNKKKYGAAILSAAVSYGGFNPDSQLANLLKTGADVPTDTNGQPLVDSSQPASGATTSPVYSPDVTSTPLSALDANAPVTPLTNVGTPISQVGNTGNLGSTDYTLGGTGSSGTGLQGQVGSGVNLYQPNAIDPTTGLPYTGLGLQPSGSTNITSMGGGQGLTIPSATGSSVVPNAVTGGGGTTTIGTGGLPVNPLTNAPLGTALANTNTGVVTPSSMITNTAGNVVGTPAGVNTSTGVIPPVASTGSSLLTPQNALIGSAALNTLGALSTNKAIANAAGTQAQAGQAAQSAISDFGKTYGQLQAPYQQTGVQALNTLGSLGSGTYNIMNPDGTVNTTGTGSGYQTHQFNAQDLQAGLAPNYDFMLAQGAGANRNLANASGGQISGNTLQGLNTFNQNYASNAYQNAFNNYQTQRQNIFANLAQQAGLGGTSLGQLGSVGSSLANTYGNVTTGLAASQAGATTAQAVNTQNALSNIGNTALLTSLIKPTAPNLA
jgi:hypothetical protein